MKWKNEITERLNCEYPIIQAPMFGVTTPEMVSAASRAGCMGSLPLGDLPKEKCVELIRATKKMADHAFVVNLFVNTIPPLDETLKIRYTQAKRFIERLALEHHFSIRLPQIDELVFVDYHDQLDAVIDENCKLISFTFGTPDQQSIERLKNAGTILIGTCTSVQEAGVLESLGTDIICVQGLEAGGHRGSFLPGDIPQIGGFSLLSQVRGAVQVPVIYAGGIYNGKTLMAAKTLGAQGFQVGSLLLGSSESALKEFEKKRLRQVTENEIVLTKSFSGRYARGIKNVFIEALEHSENILPYPYQNKLTAELRMAAKAIGNDDFVSIWLGQSINRYSPQSTSAILEKLIDDTGKEFD
jgi:nitronate monooxygenase